MDSLGPITAAPNETAAITDAHAPGRTGASDAAFEAFLGLAVSSGPAPASLTAAPVASASALNPSATPVNEPTSAGQIDVAAIAAAITAAIKISPAQAAKPANALPVAIPADEALDEGALEQDALEEGALAVTPFAPLQVSDAPNPPTANEGGSDRAVDDIVEALTHIIAPLLAPTPHDLSKDAGADEQPVQRSEPAPQSIEDLKAPQPVTRPDARDQQTVADIAQPLIAPQRPYEPNLASEAAAPLLNVAPERPSPVPSQATPAPVQTNEPAQDDADQPDRKLHASLAARIASPASDMTQERAVAQTTGPASSDDAAQSPRPEPSDAQPTTLSSTLVMSAPSLHQPTEPVIQAALTEQSPADEWRNQPAEPHSASASIAPPVRSDAPAPHDEAAPASTTSPSPEPDDAKASPQATAPFEPATLPAAPMPLSAPAPQHDGRAPRQAQEFPHSSRKTFSSPGATIAGPDHARAQAAPIAPAQASQTSGVPSSENQGPRLAAAQTTLIEDALFESETHPTARASVPTAQPADARGESAGARRLTPAEPMQDAQTRGALVALPKAPAAETLIATAPLPPTPEFSDAIFRMELRRAAPMKSTAAPDKTDETTSEPDAAAPNPSRTMAEPATHVRRAESAAPHDAPSARAHTQEPTSEAAGARSEPDTRPPALESPKQDQSAAPSRDPRQRQLTEDLRARALERQVIAAARDGSDQIRMQLYPPGLGQVLLRIAFDGGKLKLQARTTSAEAADALRDVADALSDALSLSGLHLSSFDVSDEQTGDGRKRTSPSHQPASEKSESAFSIDLNA